MRNYLVVNKKTKYGNIKTEYNGIVFDSKKEANFCKELDVLKNAKDPKEKVLSYDLQVKYPIYINDKKICDYIADFVVRYGDHRVEVIDVKGVKTDVYKLKKKMIEAYYNFKIVEK